MPPETRDIRAAVRWHLAINLPKTIWGSWPETSTSDPEKRQARAVGPSSVLFRDTWGPQRRISARTVQKPTNGIAAHRDATAGRSALPRPPA
jgi:hypothetical protein